MTEDHAGRLAGLLKRAENAIRYVIRRTDDEMVIEKSKELLTETTAALADWREHGGWTPVAQIPEEWRDGRPMHVFSPAYGDTICHPATDENGPYWLTIYGGMAITDATHVRPLPPPPEDRNG